MMKPLLAGKADLEKITYPVLGSPKLDGIRCLGMEGGPVSRTLKPIPNRHIHATLADLRCVGLDGELMVQGDFNSVQSAVMGREGEPDFVYHVFDCFLDGGGRDISDLPFEDRLAIVEARCARMGAPLRAVPHRNIPDEEALFAALDAYMEAGYEGLMLRDPGGRYKYGRSTAKEGILLKVKKFHDAEGELIEIIEKMHNANPAEKDELGHTKRSSAKANLVPAGTSGALVVRWNDLEFKVGFGPGLDDAVKLDWWRRRDQLVGRALKFAYQELSKDGVPRFGKALGFRHPDDM
jgi:DNA ligase-1